MCYIVWGDQEELLNRSVTSVRLHHPDLPIHVERIPGEHSHEMLMNQTRMARISPFRTTLYLDTDTIVLGNLGYGFEMAERFGIALCINECPWARRYTGLKDAGDLVEYNVGVVFFTAAAGAIFRRWEFLTNTLDSECRHGDKWQYVMAYNPQASFANAMVETRSNPYVLPVNWNFRPQWHKSYMGPLKIYHQVEDMPQEWVEANEQQSKEKCSVNFLNIIGS